MRPPSYGAGVPVKGEEIPCGTGKRLRGDTARRWPSPSRGQWPPQDPPCQHLDPGLPACRTVGPRVLAVEAAPQGVTSWKGRLAHRDGKTRRMSWWQTPVRAGLGFSREVRSVLGKGCQAEAQEETGDGWHAQARVVGPLRLLPRLQQGDGSGKCGCSSPPAPRAHGALPIASPWRPPFSL